MFDFRIAYSGFAGLNFVFTRVLERFAIKTKLKQFLHRKSIYLNPHKYVKYRICNFFHTHEKSTLTECANSM